MHLEAETFAERTTNVVAKKATNLAAYRSKNAVTERP
jgi:hypothetical protein